MPASADPDILNRRGERRQVTAIFVDVVGFSDFASTADAEDLQDWLDGFYGSTGRIVDAGGGEITEFLGDGIVAVFGLTRAEELAARKAVEAALAIARLPCFTFPDGRSVALRAGVATGEVATRMRAAKGTDGPLPRMTGMVTTLAQRLQSAAAPGEVLIAAETHELLRGALPARARPDTVLKGFGPMTVYCVDAGQQTAGGMPGEDLRDQPFIGRTQERDRIREVTDRACLLVGPAGIGKSALAGTFLTGDQPCAVFQADALEGGAGHVPFRRWLRSLFGGAQPDFGQLRATFAQLDDDAVLGLALMLNLPQGNALLARFASGALRDRIESALSQAVRARNPCGILLFEDLHWLDSASFGVLRRLLRDIRGGPWRVLMTSRETSLIDRHLSDLPLETIRLDAFDADESRAYLDAVRPDGLSPATRDDVIRHAGGVPLFLEQLIRHAAQHNPAAGELPATLSDLLTERIDNAGPARFALLQASVLGRGFSQRLLQALAAPADDIPQLLAMAHRADILRPAGPDRWVFSHALLQRAAYRMLLRGTRIALHARVAELLQGTCADLTEAGPAMLANHQSRAQLHLPAARSYLAASQQALLRGAFSEAQDHAQSALRMCAGVAAGQPARADLEIAAYTALGSTLMQSQGYAAAPVRRAFDQVMRLASDHVAPGHGNGAALFGSYAHAIIAGDRAGADHLGQLLHRTADASEAQLRPDRVEIRLAAEAASNCGRFYSGEFSDQFDHIARIRALYDLERHAPMIAQYGMDIFAAAQMFEVPARVFCGETDSLTALLAETDAHQQALNIPVMQPYALIWGSVPLHAAGRVDEALARLQRGMAVAAEQGAEFWGLIGQCWLHVIQPTSSDSVSGREAFDGAIRTLRAIGALIGLPYFQTHYAAALARAGELTHAFDLSAAAVEEGRQSRLWCWQAETMRLHAAIAMRLGRTEVAHRHLQDAVALADSQGARLWQLRAAMDLAELPQDDGSALAVARSYFPSDSHLPEMRGARIALAG